MIHIVFNEAEVKLLREVITLDASLDGRVIQIKDDYAVGPLENIYTAEGIHTRKQWWDEILRGGDYEQKPDSAEFNDIKTVDELAVALRPDDKEIIWIWAAQNKHDVSGYYWLLQYFREFRGRVYILYLNNLPFINEKGNIFYPEWLHEIPAKEFLKAKKLAREITAGEFEVDIDEWSKICRENRGVRTLEGGKKLAQHDYDFYDAELRKFITADWQKVSKIFQHYFNKSKLLTGDAYLLWRLKTMISNNMFDVQGKVGNMKDFEVKLKE